jgi:hypothetical protein
MIIWVSSLSKQVVGYLSVEDFCVMTNRPLPADGLAIRDAVELHRTEQYIFGALRTSQLRPTLRWSLERHDVERIPRQQPKQ